MRSTTCSGVSFKFDTPTGGSASYFPLSSLWCLVWICLDVLFCTASIMHLCTISVDRFFSLAFPMRFGRNKTTKRVILKIAFVWFLSLSTSLPLCLMYIKNHDSVLINGTCQIPDPVYKLVGSIICFYIPLFVMLLTYCLTIRLLAKKSHNLDGMCQPQPPGWASIWLGQSSAFERRRTWRQLLRPHSSTVTQAQSANSTDTELSTLDTHELWLTESNTPKHRTTTVTALQQFGAEMLKLSRGLESVASSSTTCSPTKSEFSSSNHFAGNSPQHYAVNKQAANQQHQHQHQHLHHHHHHHHHQQQQQQQQHLSGEHQQIPTAALAAATTDSTSLLLRSSSLRRSARRGRKRSLSPSCKSQHTMVHCKNRRRYSTATQGTREPRPDTPPPQRRNRFNSLPKNALLFLSCQGSQASCSNDGDASQAKGHSDSEVEQANKSQYKSANEKEIELPPVCTCPYFGDRPLQNCLKPAEVKIVPTTFTVTNAMEIENLLNPTEEELSSILVTSNANGNGTVSRLSPNSAAQMNANNMGSSLTVHSSDGSASGYLSAAPPPGTPCPGRRKLSISKTASVVTWDASRHRRRGSSFGSTRTTLLLTPTKTGPVVTSSSSATPLQRSATLRSHNNMNYQHATATSSDGTTTIIDLSRLRPQFRTPQSSPCLLQRNQTVRSHHSRNSSVISRNSSRHGRIIKLEQKATKVLGVVFFTFVILWSPFFVINLLPTICGDCENRLAHWVFDVVTWLGYASSMVNPIFYTTFNEIFRQAFKKVLLCKFSSSSHRSQNM
ncbi:lateral signaling target protein 2 homolog [Rhagoletis pomonella]|uniref:lateral signaling target protein 2 homolog n=1 Tax=Rhagoletis pomonella TaxID=28610 RepID=UPI0017800AAB|nr:lateral signaling target protein 2 homolog [Rhagoletis pomonella]